MTTGMTMVPRVLYRSLLRNAKSFEDYNFRTYAIRRVKTGFQKSRSLQGEGAIQALRYGEEQLAVMQRQATLSHLYPSAKSVMEQA